MEERTRTRMSLVAKITTKADQPGFCQVTWVHRLSLENRNGVGVSSIERSSEVAKRAQRGA
jgi:hypothetical protein